MHLVHMYIAIRNKFLFQVVGSLVVILHTNGIRPIILQIAFLNQFWSAFCINTYRSTLFILAVV